MKTVHITTHYPRFVKWHGHGKDLTCLDIFKKQTPNNTGIWEDIMLVNNPSNSDYIATIQWESADEKELLENHPNKFWFPYEPTYIKTLNRKLTSNYKNVFHFDDSNAIEAVTWWLKYDYNYLSNLQPPEKKYYNIVSIVDSGKNKLPGHQMRLKCIEDLVKEIPDYLHVYGRITREHKIIKPPYKYELPYRANEEALIPYRYYLAIENGESPFYFSERIRDPILCWTVPLYWGCPNIARFFPEESYINIDPNDPNLKDILIKILKEDDYESRIPALAEARDLILNKYNFIPTIKRAIDTGSII